MGRGAVVPDPVLDPPEFDVVTPPVLNVNGGILTECTEWLTVRAVVMPITAKTANTASRQTRPSPEPKPRRTEDARRVLPIWLVGVVGDVWITGDVWLVGGVWDPDGVGVTGRSGVITGAL